LGTSGTIAFYLVDLPLIGNIAAATHALKIIITVIEIVYYQPNLTYRKLDIETR